MKGGKLHHRQKRTIGDIINWKLNLLQSIFGGITGLFGGGKKPGGRPRPGYGRPTRPARPSYGGNTQRPQRPSYGGGGGGGRPQGRPQGRPRPNYGGQGGGQQQQAQGGSQVFGPASVFHMLPAPNLATEAPQVSPKECDQVKMILEGFCSVSKGANLRFHSYCKRDAWHKSPYHHLSSMVVQPSNFGGAYDTNRHRKQDLLALKAAKFSKLGVFQDLIPCWP